MLAYFDTSGHDDQTLRETFGRTTTPEYAEWAVSRGIFQRTEGGAVGRGPRWGDPRLFCESDLEYHELLKATPAIYGFRHAGPRRADPVTRECKTNESIGREAIYSELRADELSRSAPFRILATRAQNKESHLNSPDLGSRLSEESVGSLAAEGSDVQIIVSDGLSAEAIHHNVAELLPVLMDGLASKGVKVGRPILARYGRVKLAEHVLDCVHAKLAVMLIGERPGGDALASRSMSAYLVYALRDPAVQREAAAFSHHPDIRFEYTVITNIYSAGLPSVEAGSVIAERVHQILGCRAAGNRLEAVSKAGR
jgi:ethanolamine ammonia-lyase large subunit